MRIYTYQNRNEKRSRRTNWKLKKLFRNKKAWTWIFRITASGILFLALVFAYYSKDLPDPNKLLSRNVPESTKIYARDGSLLYEIHGEIKRTLVSSSQIADTIKHATIAIEDKDFYKEGGISITGIMRSVIVDVLSGKRAQGGSTITQQFVKNAILTNDKSWDRKIKEVILAVEIDSRYTKEQVLQLYLNEIPYGRNAYGVEAGSQSYFGKSAKDLDLAESAYLASFPQSTTRYNPFGPNRKLLDDRKNTVLTQMQQQGYISPEQEKEAKAENVNFVKTTTAISAPQFVFYVQDYLAGKYGEKSLEQGGLKVYTTLDPNLQKIAEQAVKDGVDKNAVKYNAHNGALVAIDPKTGQILAMVGSKDYFGVSEPAGCTPGKNCTFEPNVNVAVSQRQPGSSFKPYVYSTAFKKEFGYAPASMLFDVTTDFGKFGNKDYVPGNYDGQEHGPVNMRKALAGSLNIPAVKTLALVGVQNATQTAHDLGITSPLANCGLSLVLGGCEVTLLDHTAAYSVFANGGVKNEKTAILKIEDKSGNILEEYKANPQAVLDPQAVYELISIMTDNDARSFVFGSHSPLILPGRLVAAKTGTTQNWHDGWTLGFTPSLAAGVWTGNNDGTLLKKGADGVVVAAPIWNAFMKAALQSMPAEDFPVPSNIKSVQVDEVSGKLPTTYTSSTKTETFADYAVPTQYDDVHIGVATDSTTGQPATSLTPPEQIIYKTYTVFHSEKKDNPNWENPVVAWALAHGYSYPPGDGTVVPVSSSPGPTVTILEPQDSATISKLPLQVSVSAVSTNPIARVDISVDGQFLQSLNSSPYTFNISQNYPDGDHTIAIKAVDTTGLSSDSSVTVNFALNAAIIITQPQNNSTLTFPLTLSATSPNPYGTVSFYYQPEKGGSSKLIGQASNVSSVSGSFVYTLDWNSGPSAGIYKIFAQTDNGLTTPKVKVTVP